MNKDITDLLNLSTKINARKVVNAAKVWTSFWRSRYTQKVVHPAYPLSMSIEPTTSCNLRCPECPSGLRSFTRPTGMLQVPLFQKIIDEVADHLIFLTFYFQGEPYLNPDFLEMTKYASQRKIYTSTSTNAHYLSKENAIKTVKSGLDRLIISIDGTTQETYESYRIGGKLSKVLEGARNIVEAKKQLNSKTPHTIFQFLVVKPNQHQIEEVNTLAQEIGIDEVVFKTAQVYNYEYGNDLIPTLEKYSRYRRKPNGKYAIKNELLNRCWRMWQSCVVTWDGNIVPCCFDKDADHVMGNLETQNFKDIWNGESYQAFRTQLLSSRQKIEMCKNCTEGSKVFA